MEFHFPDSPLFTVLPEDVTGNNGDKINLHCEVDSNPPAVVSWTKDGNKYQVRIFRIFLCNYVVNVF